MRGFVRYVATPLFAVLLCLFWLPSSSVLAVETLDWAQCLAEATAHHPDLRSAAESVRQSEAQRKIVKGGMLPTVSASAGGTRLASTDAAASGSWSYGVNASQLLFDGAKTSSEVNAATASLKASRFNEQTVSVDTRYALRAAFVQLLTAQQQVSLAEQIMTKRKQNLRLIGLLYKSGTENIGSLSKAQADLAESEFEVAQARRALDLARLVLSTQLGRRTFTPLRVTGQFTASEQARTPPDFDSITRNHPTYLNLVAQKDAAGYNLQASKSAFMPSVSVSTGFGNSAFRQLPPDRTDWQAGIDVSVPIYAGGAGRAREAKARAVVNQLRADEESLYFSLMRRLEEAWKNFCDTSEKVDVQKKYFDAAAERARIADAQYSAGLVSFNDWTIIEDNFVAAKKSYLNAQSNLLTAEAAWVQAKGGSLEAR